MLAVINAELLTTLNRFGRKTIIDIKASAGFVVSGIMAILVSSPNSHKKATGSCSRKIYAPVNIALIAIAVLIGIGLAMKRLFIEAPHSASGITVGRRAPLPNIDWAKNEQTLLLVLQKGCHFCAESAPFYQRLVQETTRRGSARLIAVIPQGSDESSRYLDEIGVPVDEVKRAPLATLQVSDTPALILVNSGGVVTGSWLGKLTVEQECEVLKRLQEDTVAGR